MTDSKPYKCNINTERYTEYIHSSDSLFHFMDQLDFLKEILEKRAIFPRYCRENVDYLNLELDGCRYSEILVLQKCFCDIPLHDITQKAMMHARSEEGIREKDVFLSHTDIYGTYGIAFSKDWAEQYNLQPVQYLNPKSSYCREAGRDLMAAYEIEELDDLFVDSFLRRLTIVKPLKGWMKRQKQEIYKIFHDEREWRYVPDCLACRKAEVEYVIANQNVTRDWKMVNQMNNDLLKKYCYQNLWISYEYDDICYLIVPDNQARLELIGIIMNIPDKMFDLEKTDDEKQLQKLTMVSKILVLDQIRKDW